MRTRLRKLLPASAIAAIALAGCGSSPGASAGKSGRQSFKSVVASAYAYAACLRSHGVANYPDPTVNNSGPHQGITITHPAGLDPTAPRMRAALKACRGVGPAAGSGPPANNQPRQDAMLAFASCMRAHHFPRFPDPTIRGELDPGMVAAAGINLRQPALLSAALACVSVTHGRLTAADIRRSLTNASGSPAGPG